MSLTFNEAAHRYRMTKTPGKATDYKGVTGVTTILDGGVPKPGLIGWAGRTVAEFAVEQLTTADPVQVARWRAAGGDEMKQAALARWLAYQPTKIKEDAGDRGTLIHDIAERILLGYAVEVPKVVEKEIEGFVDLLDRFGIEPHVEAGHPMTEVSVGNREHWYSGRLDTIASIEGLPGGLKLVDFKSSNYTYGDTSLQTGAYSRAEFWVTDEDPDTERPLPEVDGCVVLHITPGRSYLHWLARTPAEIDEAFVDFTHALHTHRNKKRREQRLSIPLEPTNRKMRTA